MSQHIVHQKKNKHPGIYKFTVDRDYLESHNRLHHDKLETSRLLPPPPCGLSQKAKVHDLQVPLPPCIFQPPSTVYSTGCIRGKLYNGRNFDLRGGLRKICHSCFGFWKQEKDPFLAAYKECTKNSRMRGKLCSHRKFDPRVGLRKVCLSSWSFLKQEKSLLTARKDCIKSSSSSKRGRFDMKKVYSSNCGFRKQEKDSLPADCNECANDSSTRGKAYARRNFDLRVDLKKIYSRTWGFRKKETDPFLTAYNCQMKSSSSMRAKLFGDRKFDFRIGARKILSKLSCKKICNVKDAIQVGMPGLSDMRKE
ncbi:hypothetical protein Ancab_016595 [Ancistrocladus abbreviatus]